MLVSWGQFNKTFTSVVYKRSCCFQTPKQWPLVKVLFNWSQITIGVRLKIVLWFQMCGLSNTWALKVTAHYYRIFSASGSASKFTCLTFTIQKFNSDIFVHCNLFQVWGYTQSWISRRIFPLLLARTTAFCPDICCTLFGLRWNCRNAIVQKTVVLQGMRWSLVLF